MSKITIARVYRVTDGSALVTNMSDVSPANGGNIQVEAITDFDPTDDGEVRYTVIDSETISYTDINEDTDELLNITRAANGSVAAAHTPGTFVQAGLNARSEKFADGFIDDDEALAQGVEIMRHLWRMYPVGPRDNDEMEMATVRYLDDDHPIIIDSPDDDRAGSPTFFTWSRHGNIAVGTRPHRFPVPYGGSLEEFRMTLGEDGEADDDVIADILKDGVSILTTKLEIPAGSLISPRVIPTTKEIRKGDILQVEFEQVGSSDAPGANPTVYGTLYPSEAVVAGRIEVEGPDGDPGADGADGADGLISEVRDEGTPVTDAPVMDFTGAGVDVTSDGSVITVDIPGGGGGGGGLLAVTAYRPGSEQNKTTTSTSFVDADATNLAVTFTAPSSGKVLVRLSSRAGMSVTTSFGGWGLREGSTVVADQQVMFTGNTQRYAATFYVTGLTPGNSYTYKWAFVSGHTTATHTITMGGGLTAAGQALMEVWEAI